MLKFDPSKPVCLGPFTLHLAFSGGRFSGISEVLFGDTPLRSPQLPWTFYTESEQGWRFCRFDLLDVRQQGGESVVLDFESEGEWLPRLQEADAMGDARVRTRRAKPPRVRFQWTLRRIVEQIGDNAWEGLAMQLEVESPGYPLHWILEDTTWEIGGTAAGCTLIQQDISTIDLEQTVREDSAFSTIERFFTEGWGGAYPMDMLPRAAGAAICDFQTRGDLALCLFAEHPGLTRARLEKFADENIIHYTERPFFRLAEKIRTPERKLLVHRHAKPLRRHEWRNLWLDCFTGVRERILKPYGFEVEIPLPSVHSHLWDDDLKKLGAEWLVPLEEALPGFARLGYRQTFTHGVWDSITSDPDPAEAGNICCPYQFRFADMFGGEAAMKRLTERAEAAGIDIYQWFSFHLSRHAEVWKEHPDWVLREANGDPWDGNYNSLWSGRFLSPYGDWMRNQVKDTCAGAGLTGIFWDSYQNLGVTCVDWGSPDKSPQADEIWKFQAELQRQGIGQRCEIITIFGVSAVAVYGFESDKFRRRLWSDSVRNDDVFALMDTSPGFFSDRYPYTAEGITPEIYFWLVAHRVVPGLNASPWGLPPKNPRNAIPAIPGGELAEAYAGVNHLYNAALPHMKRLRLVEEATHVLWLDGENQPAVLWAFRDAEVSFQGPARELRDGVQAECEGFLKIGPGQVWILGDRDPASRSPAA